MYLRESRMRTIVHEHVHFPWTNQITASWDLQQTKEEGLGLELAVLCETLSMDALRQWIGQSSLGESHRLGSSWTYER